MDNCPYFGFVFLLVQEANEAGALRVAKSKLEKQLEDLTWRLHLEKKLRVPVFNMFRVLYVFQ